MNGMQKAILIAVVLIAAVAAIWGVAVNLALRIVGGYVLGVLTGIAIKSRRKQS
jgi:hypothetical protein